MAFHYVLGVESGVADGAGFDSAGFDSVTGSLGIALSAGFSASLFDSAASVEAVFAA